MIQRIREESLSDVLGRVGLRATRQRQLVYKILLDKGDHPTADELLSRARSVMPSISLATVYSCIETLVECGLVRTVSRDRSPTRYCANRAEHAHFHDTGSGQVYDVPLPSDVLDYIRRLAPEGFEVDELELNFIGRALAPSRKDPAASPKRADREDSF